MRRREVLGLGITAGLLASCQTIRLPGTDGRTAKSNALEIWWSEGYYPEETDALESVVRAWEQKSGHKANLRFFSENEITARAQSAIEGASAPDVLYGYGTSETIIPALRHKGRIAPLEDIIVPMKKNLLSGVINSITYNDRDSRSRSIFGAPLSQHSTNIHYWRDLLEEATGAPGASMVPRNWEGFWTFWSDCQARLRKKGYTNMYAMALPMSSQARDTSHIFEFFLEAHGVELISPTGQLQIDSPRVRQGIMAALEDYTSLYKEKVVPPHATRWSDADNNINFLSSLSLMTANPTLSIPGSQLSDEIAYFERLGSLQWPNRLDGQPMRSVVTVNQAVVFYGPKLREAMNFLAFLLKPENLSAYVQGAQGRFLPANSKIIEMAYWQNPKDQHLRTAIANLKSQRKAYSVLNSAYSAVIAKNLWGHAIESIASRAASVNEASDKLALEIKDIFRSWG